MIKCRKTGLGCTHIGCPRYEKQVFEAKQHACRYLVIDEEQVMSLEEKLEKLGSFCVEPRWKFEILEKVGLQSCQVDDLVDRGVLRRTPRRLQPHTGRFFPQYVTVSGVHGEMQKETV